MSEAAESREILEELRDIKKDLSYIKAHMVDADTILTLEEDERLEESVKEYKEGKSVSLKEFEKEMGK